MKGALKERHVSKDVQIPARLGVTLQSPAATSQQHKRKIGPLRLLVEPAVERVKAAAADGFFGHHRHAGPASKLLNELPDIADDIALEPRLGEHIKRNESVPSVRGQDQCPFRSIRPHSAAMSPS